MSGLWLRVATACGLLVSIAFAVDQLTHSIAIDVVTVCVLILLLCLAFGRVVLRPLGHITAAADSIAAGNYSARVSPLPDGEIGALAQTFNRMAEEVAAQVATAAQERSRLLAVLNSSADAAAAVDHELRVLLANHALERLFDKQAGEIVGKPFSWLLADEPLLDAMRASRDARDDHTVLTELSGRRYVQAFTTPIQSGGDWSVLVTFHDVTEIRRMEQVRRDFIANVSHELRTPLSGIKSVIETLSAGALDDRQVAEDFLQRADSEVDRLVELVEELIELSRIESGELPLSLQPTNLRALVEQVANRLHPLADRKRQRLKVEVGDDVGDVMLDPTRIERALINLVQNAIKFTPDEGSITISADRTPDSLLLRVRDNGIGIAAEDLPRVFERFYKVDHARAGSGSGLGLALVKHAVEAHGGHASVESQPGSGSNFLISLPIAS